MNYEDLATVEGEMLRLQDILAAKAMEKRKHEVELATLNNRVRSSGRHGLQHTEYVTICRRQNALRNMIAKCEEEMLPIRTEKNRWHVMGQEIRAKGKNEIVKAHFDDKKEDLPWQKLIALRDKWQRFAEDPTRVNSMRLLAASFAKDLTAVVSGKSAVSEEPLATTFEEGALQ